MKIANKKLISKLFVRHSSGDKRRNDGKKNSIDFVIKLNENDYMFERNVTTRDQCKSSSCKQTISLQGRVCQILPKFMRTGRIPNSRNISTRSGKSSTPVMFSKSAIGQHFLNSFICVKNYKKFAIFSFGRLPFHLSALEAVYIKSCKQNLCRQKEFVYNLKLLRLSRVVTLLSNIQSSSFSFITKLIEFFSFIPTFIS